MRKTAEQIADAVLTKISTPSDPRIARAFLSRLEGMIERDPTFAWRHGTEGIMGSTHGLSSKAHEAVKNVLETPVARYEALEQHPLHLPSAIKQLKKRLDEGTLVQSRIIHPHDVDYPARFRSPRHDLYPFTSRQD